MRIVDVLHDSVVSITYVNAHGRTCTHVIALHRGVHYNNAIRGIPIRIKVVKTKSCLRVHQKMQDMAAYFAEPMKTTYFARLFEYGYVGGIWEGRNWLCRSCQFECITWTELLRHYGLPLALQRVKFTKLSIESPS